MTGEKTLAQRQFNVMRSSFTAPGMWLAWLVLAGCLFTTVWAWYFLSTGAESDAKGQFEIITDEIGTSVQRRMSAYEQVLRGGAGLFAASRSVERDEWHAYVQSLHIDKNLPGIQGIGYAQRIAPEEKDAHIRAVRAEGFPDYTIKPAGERAEYTAIVFLEPFSARNQRAFGFDMFSEPVRRAAMEQARDSGQTAISGKVKLLQETKSDVQAGFLMYFPLYRKNVTLDTLEQRRTALIGYVYSPFRMNDLMRGILGKDTRSIDLEIFDGSVLSDNTLMYDDDSSHGVTSGHRAQLTRIMPVEINGRSWTLRMSSLPTFEAKVHDELPQIIAQGGILVSLLLFAIVWSLITTRSRALALAQNMTTSLRENEAFTHSILDNVVDGIITIDGRGNITSFNPAAEKIFGYEAAEVLGQNVKMLMPEPYHTEHDGYIANHVRTGERKIIGIGREVSGIRKNGEIFPLDLAVSDMSQGQRRMFAGIMRDITERKKIDRLKNEFVSTVSHELRTPLTSIRGSLGLVAGGVAGSLPEQAKQLVGIAYSNCERLISLINDILDIEKIESGKMKFELQPQPLLPIAEQSIEAHRSYGAEFGVTFELIATTPEIQVNVDRDRLMQVLSNLLSNAAKFSPRGARVEITITSEAGQARISVKDHGPGIPDEFRDRIFLKFSQADSSDTRQKGGTGLGLNITKSIVEKMGGTISFDSQSGSGTTFHVALPEWNQQRPAGLLTHQTTDATAPRILVCEDDRDIALLIGTILKQAGFESDFAYTAAETKTLLKTHTYAAMTLDLALPDQDGASLLRELRTQEATRNLPVVVVSANAEEGRAQLNGVFAIVDWLTKPIDPARLVDDVRRAAHSIGGYRARILHVEDDPDIRHIVAGVAKDLADFDFATTLEEAKAKLALERYQLIVLDIGLPDGSGWDLLPALTRLDPQPAVLIFSAQDFNSNQAQGAAAALLKSTTSNPQLLATISSLIRSQTEFATS